MNNLDNLKIYKENNRIILLNEKNMIWARMPEEVYDKYSISFDKKQQLSNELEKRFQIFSFNKTEEIPKIQSLYLSLTNKCNMQCQFCSANSGPNITTDQDITLNKYQDIVIPKLKKLDLKKIIFTGGEPTLNKDLIPIIKLFSETFTNTILILQSNGLLLNKELLDKLSSYIHAIEISIENLFEDSNLLYKMSEIFNYINSKNINLIFSFVLHKKNFLYVKKALDLTIKYQAKFELRLISPIGRAKEFIKSNGYTDKELLVFYKQLLQYVIHKKYYTEDIIDLFIGELQCKKMCGGYGKIVSIESNGDIHLCANFTNSCGRFGNIIIETIDEIVNSLAEKLKKEEIKALFDVSTKEVCKKCDVEYFCLGPCAALIDTNLSELFNWETIKHCNFIKCFLKFSMFYFEPKISIEDNLKKLLSYLNNTINEL